MLPSTITDRVSNANRGMSTVVGAILVVGITVVLAAIIGGFVFGIGDDLSNTQPQAQITFDYNAEDADGNTQLQIVHDGGETITDENTGSLRITGDATGELDNTEFTVTSDDPADAEDTDVSAPKTSGQELISTSGTDGVGNIDSSNVESLESGDTVNLVWVSNDGSQSNQLGSFTIPEN